MYVFLCLPEFLQPYKPRPETSATAARRLVAGALGLATNVSREKRDLERQQLRQAKGGFFSRITAITVDWIIFRINKIKRFGCQ